MKVVLAHFRPSKIKYNIAVNGAILSLAIGLILFGNNGHFIVKRYDIYLMAFLFSVIAILYYLIFEILLIKQVMFGKYVALWIEDGLLIYLHRLFLSKKCTDVEAISVGTYSRYKRAAIVLILRGGGKKMIPSGALAEPQRDIIDRLSAELGIEFRAP